MNNLPLVSVIVPCYNHELYVKECIESIVNQTYNNIQLIVIDDGSKDKSPVILKELQKQYGFILECQENIGLTKTLNKALGYVQGKYYCAMASDDYWCLDKITKQVSYLEENPDIGFVFGKCHVVKDGIIIGEIGANIKNDYLCFENILKDDKIPALTVMSAKDIVVEVGGYDENLWIEDWDMWLKIANKYPVGYMDEYLGYYRNHGSNSSKNPEKMLDAIFAILEKWENNMDKSLHSKVLNSKRMDAFNIYSALNKKRALRYWPKKFKSYFDKRFIKGIIKLLFIRRNG